MVMVYKIIHGLDGAPFDDFSAIIIYLRDLMDSSYINILVDLMLESSVSHKE